MPEKRLPIIHLLDHCEAVPAVFEKEQAGSVYNICSNNERSNLELNHLLLAAMGLDESQVEYVKNRPGHDRRYKIDSSRIQHQLGWEPTRSAWPTTLEQAVAWYREHKAWWRRVKSGPLS